MIVFMLIYYNALDFIQTLRPQFTDADMTKQLRTLCGEARQKMMVKRQHFSI